MLKIGSCHCSLSPFFVLPFFIRLHPLYPNNVHSYTIKQYDVYCVLYIYNLYEYTRKCHSEIKRMIAPRWFVLVCAAFTSFKKKQKNFFLIHFFPLLFLDVSLCFSAICMGLSMRNSRPGCLEKIAKYIEIRKNSVVIWLEDTWWHQSSMVFDLTVSHWSLGATSSPWPTHIMMTFCPWGDVFFLFIQLKFFVVVVVVVCSGGCFCYYVLCVGAFLLMKQQWFLN